MKNLVNLVFSAVVTLFAGGCYAYYEPVSSTPQPAYASKPQPVYNPTFPQPVNPQPVIQPNLITESQERVEHIQMHHDPDYAQGIEYNSTQEHIDAEIKNADPTDPEDVREAQIIANRIKEKQWYEWLARQKALERRRGIRRGIRTTPHRITRR